MANDIKAPIHRLYKVTFAFVETYSRKKDEGFENIVIVVSATNQMDALANAWTGVSTLNLPEPVSFSAERIDKT